MIRTGFPSFLRFAPVAVVLALLPVPGDAFDGAAFNPDGLRLDPRLGIVHVGAQYPDRRAQGDMLVYGADAAAALGFSTIEVFLDPRICRGANDRTMPGSLYQTGKYCRPDAPARMAARDLQTLAAQPDFAAVFADSAFRRIVLTFDPLDPRAASQSQISKLDADWAPEQLERLKAEVRGLAAYLAQTYSGTGKTFVLSAPSEMDWHLTATGTGRGGCDRGEAACATLDANPQAVRNTIAYLNAIHDAIAEGVAAVGAPEGVSLLQACEVNFVTRTAPGQKTGLTEVIPNTSCDLVAWSAHEAFREIEAQAELNAKLQRAGKAASDPRFAPHPEDLMLEGLDRIAAHPPKGKAKGHRDIFIGEIGFKENHDDLDAFLATLRATLDWGVWSVDLWELFDNSCKVFDPSPAQAEGNKACKGFWLLKPGQGPDGLVPGALLEALYRDFSVPG